VFQSQHIRLNNRTMKDWNLAIQEGRATIREPPTGLVANYLEGLKARQATKKTAVNTESDSRGVIINNNFGGPSGMTDRGAPVPKSSSVRIEEEDDDDELLILYFDWWIRKRPIKASVYRELLVMLQRDNWSFSGLEDIEDKEWSKYCGGGIRVSLLRHMKIWLEDRKVDNLIREDEEISQGTRTGRRLVAKRH